MTVRDKLESMLIEYGMSELQANQVMDIAIPKLNNFVEDYKITFDRPSNEYPVAFYSILFKVIKPIALKWIEECGDKNGISESGIKKDDFKIVKIVYDDVEDVISECEWCEQQE
jgi:hypothetical protein